MMAVLGTALFLVFHPFWPPVTRNATEQRAAEPVAVPEASYLGGAACATCHPDQLKAWAGSHHDRAMAEATPDTVLGDFNSATFRRAGISSRFFRQDGAYMVRTDGPDGRLHDYPVKYTFGFKPLQQYLIEFPGGRLQALGIAWDSRSREEGGQRWFHLYPDRILRAGNPLHWTGIDQVWNYQCADCHSTNVRKNYDERGDRYATTWTDINVTCEACHGPGSNHVAWAKGEAGSDEAAYPGKGLSSALDERRGVQWALDPKSGRPVRSQARSSSREIETCARCHARRGQFTDEWHAGMPLADGFRLALIEPGLYFDDGQMREEVYNVGSMLQSRMHAKGVTCSDCHDPHSARLRATGNAVCAQCHAPATYDSSTHHHHPQGSEGAQCAACHMPVTTYMGVDRRHDHGFRIPRPDRTVRLGVPNTCSQCHADKTPDWAVAALRNWYPQSNPGFQTFAEPFALAANGAPGAALALRAVAEAGESPAYVRASAIRWLGQLLRPDNLAVVQQALADRDPLVRAGAVDALSGTGVEIRVGSLARMLSDPVRDVRMRAARLLAGEADSSSQRDRAQFAAALAEYIAAERFNADRPESHGNLGNLHATQGRLEEAVEAYRRALALDPGFEQAALNLADLQRNNGRETDAEATLRAALQRNPRSAAAHHALGLSLVRQKRGVGALKSLAEAVRLAPDDARFGYVYAVALNDAGKRSQAIGVLEQLLSRHRYDRDALLAITLFERDAGDRRRALAYARRLLELDPDSREIQQLITELGGGRP
jgi:predicted CXXCH cytochrome family protein